MPAVEVRHEDRATGADGIDARAFAEGHLHFLDAHRHVVCRADHSSSAGVANQGYTRSRDIQHFDAELGDPLRLPGPSQRGLAQ